jgi:hypothetical protein
MHLLQAVIVSAAKSSKTQTELKLEEVVRDAASYTKTLRRDLKFRLPTLVRTFFDLPNEGTDPLLTRLPRGTRNEVGRS